MTLPDDNLNRVVAAVETIEQSVAILSERQTVDLETYRESPTTQDIVERRFVKATEAALDIAEAIAVHELEKRPESNPETVRALNEAGVIDGRITEQMVQTARFRNVLAHTYGQVIDHETVYEALQDLDRYRAFLTAV